MTRRDICCITIPTTLRETHTFALVTDLHCGPWEDILRNAEGVEAILIAGDMVDRHKQDFDPALDFLKVAPSVAPVYYSFGNHEWKHPRADAWREAISPL